MNPMTNKLRWIAGSGMLGGALGLGLFGLSLNGAADWGEWGERHEYEHHESRYARQTPPIPEYVEECGSCHMAYPANLLPQRSWDALMQGLGDHFGDNAELMPQQWEKIDAYLMTHAADANAGRRSYRMIRSIGPDQAPLRITELAYFRHEHDEIPQRMVEGNPKVGSFAQCQACHGKEAERGIFDEHSVHIPGVGRWD